MFPTAMDHKENHSLKTIADWLLMTKDIVFQSLNEGTQQTQTYISNFFSSPQRQPTNTPQPPTPQTETPTTTNITTMNTSTPSQQQSSISKFFGSALPTQQNNRLTSRTTTTTQKQSRLNQFFRPVPPAEAHTTSQQSQASTTNSPELKTTPTHESTNREGIG